jgi:hypothetical protein
MRSVLPSLIVFARSPLRRQSHGPRFGGGDRSAAPVGSSPAMPIGRGHPHLSRSRRISV